MTNKEAQQAAVDYLNAKTALVSLVPEKEDIGIPIRGRMVPPLEVVAYKGIDGYRKAHKPNKGLKIGGYNSNHSQGKARKINRK